MDIVGAGVGASLGRNVGSFVGFNDGKADGARVGSVEGFFVACVGDLVFEGAIVGSNDGDIVVTEGTDGDKNNVGVIEGIPDGA